MLPLKGVCQSRVLGGGAWSIGNRLFGKLNPGKILGLRGEKLGAGFDRCSRMLQEYMGTAPIQPPSVHSRLRDACHAGTLSVEVAVTFS